MPVFRKTMRNQKARGGGWPKGSSAGGQGQARPAPLPGQTGGREQQARHLISFRNLRADRFDSWSAFLQVSLDKDRPAKFIESQSLGIDGLADL